MPCLSFGTCIVSVVLQIVPPENVFLCHEYYWGFDHLPEAVRACSSTNSLHSAVSNAHTQKILHLCSDTPLIAGIFSSSQLGENSSIGLASAFRCAQDREECCLESEYIYLF